MDLVGHAAAKNMYAAAKTLIWFKDKGFKPDSLLYHAAADALASRGLWQECWALIDDMKGAGLAPDVVMFNHLIKVRVLINTYSLILFYVTPVCLFVHCGGAPSVRVRVDCPRIAYVGVLPDLVHPICGRIGQRVICGGVELQDYHTTRPFSFPSAILRATSVLTRKPSLSHNVAQRSR
jgi:pentatricopeptide repeat protein